MARIASLTAIDVGVSPTRFNHVDARYTQCLTLLALKVGNVIVCRTYAAFPRTSGAITAAMPNFFPALRDVERRELRLLCTWWARSYMLADYAELRVLERLQLQVCLDPPV